MKTISGKPISTKPISLSKAAKILSKFVSAENGASHVISAYLHRASSSFNELNQIHKAVKSPCSDRNHKRNRSETHDNRLKIEENSILSDEINQRAAHSKNKFRKRQFGGENTVEDEEKPSKTVVKFSQEPNGAIDDHVGNEGRSERHKKKKKKHDIEFQEQGDNGVEIGEREGELKPLTRAVNKDEENPNQGVVDFSQEPTEREKHKKKKKHEDVFKKRRTNGFEFEEGSNEVKVSTEAQENLVRSVESHQELDNNNEMEEGKKHKREKKKKDKDGMNNFSGEKGELFKPEDEIAKRTKDQKEMLSNGLEGENGGLVDHQELQNEKRTGSKDEIDTDEVKRVQKKRKNEDVERRVEDRSGEPTKKIKRKHRRDD